MTFVTSTQPVHSSVSGSDSVEYQCQADLNVYDSTTLERLATQAATGRYLRIESVPDSNHSPIWVRLCEDDYPGWISPHDRQHLTIATSSYQPTSLALAEIRTRIPAAIAFTQQAMAQPNEYLWGGTVAPNYDCSGLMQAAFAAAGIWLPRDAYQQEGFTQPVALEELQPGDLIFFGSNQKATHVGLYLGDRQYIHSSGQDQGHNGIAIDTLTPDGSPVSRTYYAQLRGAGRIIASYAPSTP